MHDRSLRHSVLHGTVLRSAALTLILMHSLTAVDERVSACLLWPAHAAYVQPSNRGTTAHADNYAARLDRTRHERQHTVTCLHPLKSCQRTATIPASDGQCRPLPLCDFLPNSPPLPSAPSRRHCRPFQPFRHHPQGHKIPALNAQHNLCVFAQQLKARRAG